MTVSLDDINTWGLSEDDKMEVENMKTEFAKDGMSIEEIVTVINSFIYDCLETHD